MKREFVGKKKFPIKCKIGRGLEGAVVNNTQIGYFYGLAYNDTFSSDGLGSCIFPSP